MATRAQVRFATRREGQSFNQHPSEIHAQFYVHSDGYPEYLGVEIANSLEREQTVDSWEIESLDTKHGDLEYIYYIWQAPSKDTFISIFKTSWTDEKDECIFVGEPQKLLEKYD